MWISASLTSLRHQLAITEWNWSGSSIAGYQEKKRHFAFLAVLWHPLKFRCTFFEESEFCSDIVTKAFDRDAKQWNTPCRKHPANVTALRRKLCAAQQCAPGTINGKNTEVNLTFSFFVLEIYSFCCHIHVLNVLVLFYMLVQLKLHSKKGVWIHLRIVAGKLSSGMIRWTKQNGMCILLIFHNSWQRTYPGYLEFYVNSREYPAPSS